MIRIFKLFAIFGALLGLINMTGCAAPEQKQAGWKENVVYHVNDVANATGALRNIKNHLKANPQAHIVVVTHSKGIDFLLEGATDKNGNPYDVTVQELAKKGVQFDVCNNTLMGRHIDPKTVLPEATIVPSGVAEIAKLQSQEGYVYVKP